MKDPRPLRADEPVAYFQFDAQVQISVDIDFKRASRYVMLKPTGFRKKPHNFIQSVDTTPIEIEFFGVSGHASEENSLDAVRINDAA
jgi:ubiquitin-activating enzyme E1